MLLLEVDHVHAGPLGRVALRTRSESDLVQSPLKVAFTRHVFVIRIKSPFRGERALRLRSRGADETLAPFAAGAFATGTQRRVVRRGTLEASNTFLDLQSHGVVAPYRRASFDWAGVAKARAVAECVSSDDELPSTRRSSASLDGEASLHRRITSDGGRWTSFTTTRIIGSDFAEDANLRSVVISCGPVNESGRRGEF